MTDNLPPLPQTDWLLHMPAQGLPDGWVAVPKQMTQEMRDATDAEGWTWEDLLAAAQAITEAEYEEVAASPAQPVQPSTRMWHDRIKDEHPTSEPEYWPNALKVEYMEREILDLRALVTQAKPEQAAQQERQPLTSAEIADLWDGTLFHINDLSTATDFVRDVEALHGIAAAPQPKETP